MKRIAFDIDGCVINLQDPLNYYFKKMYNISLPPEAFSRATIEEAVNMSYEKVLVCVNECVADIYRQNFYPGSVDFIKKYHVYSEREVLFVTNRWDQVNTYKLLDRYFDDIPYHVSFIKGSKVEELKKQKVDIFVEDRVENAEEISNEGILTFLIERPWNQTEIKDSGNLIRVKDWFELEEVYKKMEE